MANRYEYMLTCGRLGLDEAAGRAFQAELNDLGSRGWRVAGMSGDILSASVLLERQLPGDIRPATDGQMVAATT